MQYNGWLVKFKNNGDVDWSKQVDEFSHNHDFLRVIRSSDNNILAFANNYYVVNHNVYRTVKLIKIDNNGTILFTKELTKNYSTEIADVTPTPEGGFIIILNESYGSGYLYSHVIRYDSSFAIVWKKEIKHSVLTPIYRSVYCNLNGVWFGHDSYDSYNAATIGIQKLDYVTGNDVWKKRWFYGNSVMRFNRIMVISDTVYAFAYKSDLPNGPTHITMLRLSDEGSMISSQLLQTDPILYPNTYNYLDVARPTVTLTPENDFVMSNQVSVNTIKALNISKFDKNGLVRWSRNFTGMNKHSVFNIHSQGTGILVLGTIDNPNNYFNTSAFMLKVDSTGIIENGAVGNCAFVNRPLSTMTYPVTQVDPRIDSVINLNGFAMAINPVIILPKKIDATLYCGVQSSCPSVNIFQSGIGCRIQDTFIFYLTNISCGVNTVWQYDTTYFSLLQISSDTIKLLPKRSGISTIHVKVDDDCSSKVLNQSISVVESASLFSLGGDTVICSGSGAITLHAGSGFQSYTWNDNSTDSTIIASTPGLYYVTVKDFCGDIKRDSILVSAAGLEFMITGLHEKCNSDTVELQGTSGYTNYEWTPTLYVNATNNIAQVNPPSTMFYYLKAEKFPGCIVRDTFLINVKTSPPLQLGNDTTICYDKSIKFSAQNGFDNYLWNTGNTTNNITVTNPGVYIIEANYPNNCVSKDTILLSKYLFISPKLGNDTSICINTFLELNPGNYANYLWSNNSLNNTITIGQKGDFWVNVIDNYGCSGSDSIKILTKECLQGFYIPSAFTPNRDGKNDLLKPILMGKVKKYNFIVYNRWGEIIFSSSELNKGWDGTYKGQSQEGNVFVWSCVYQFEGEPQQIKKGSVILIR